MSILDKLLETDIQKLKGEKIEVEIKRLSKMFGEPFIISCTSLTCEQVNHLVETSKTNTDTKINTVLEACKIEGKKFSDKVLIEKLGVLTGKEVIQKLLRPGEITALYDTVSKLSGYGVDVVKEIKN